MYGEGEESGRYGKCDGESTITNLREGGGEGEKASLRLHICERQMIVVMRK